ncbi:MAG: N-6 DNA methylase [Chloroflexota bacterium]|nr:N-6 DNA methylase [Chloroflexota bacterium]
MVAIDEISEIDAIEKRRLEIQNLLDAAKTKSERNRLGQFATPTDLARDILEYSSRLLSEPHQSIRFLDPAFGTGAFYSALLKFFQPSQIEKAQGYEIDPHFAQPSAELWANTPLELKATDFTRASPSVQDRNRANLLVCNPPYVRHHHLSTDEKARLQNLVRNRVGVRLSGLAGLYCYFLLISHDWLSEGGLAGWLIPSEFMSVNYGTQIRQYLLRQVTLLHIHRFSPEDVQFGDALVSSAVVWFRKQDPSANHEVKFSYGGALSEPRIARQIPVADLRRANKWIGFFETSSGTTIGSGHKALPAKTRLLDWFDIKRGLVTGANKFFILTREQIEKHSLSMEFFIPILPSPRYLVTGEIEADKDGNPVLDQKLFLLACNLPAKVVKTKYPALWKYLQEGVRRGIDKRYLCRHRSPWYSQESRPASPLLCNYMGRISSENKGPFRFFLNHSEATAPNVYLMLYPRPAIARQLRSKPELLKTVWKALDAIPASVLMGVGRVYGGGLYKIEPGELAAAPADNIAAVLSSANGKYLGQLPLFTTQPPGGELDH